MDGRGRSSWQVALGGSSRPIRIEEELIVAPMKAGGSAAQWRGELPPVPEGVARTIGRMRRSILNTIDGSDLEDSVELCP